jgi:hypothetical protein
VTLYAWKFIVPTDRFYPMPDPKDGEFRGCVAVALAEDEAAARARLLTYGEEFGVDMRWIQIARVTRLNADRPGTLVVALL